MDKLYVRKLVSLNPDRYEKISLKKAIRMYARYCYIFGKAETQYRNDLKTFEQWLETEI